MKKLSSLAGKDEEIVGSTAKQNRYDKVIEAIFFSSYKAGMTEIHFEREDMIKVCSKLKIDVPKNIGDLIYSYRYRRALPEAIRKTADGKLEWIIMPAGRSLYKFVLSSYTNIVPTENFSETKIPDSTPGIIAKYSLSDEQALLAVVRYNRLIDIFTGLTCYSLQNHLRTTVKFIGQVEVDELYIGIEKRGVHYVIPVQAKGGADKLGIVQIEQDAAACKEKFPSLICKPVAAQFIDHSLIALFEFEITNTGIKIVQEKHYRLVPTDKIDEADLELYRQRTT